VLRADLDWSALPAGLPSNIRTMLRRCLERDPKRRLRDIGDARIELEQRATEQTAPAAVPVPRRSLLVAWIVAAVMTVVAAAVTVILVRESPPAAPLARFDVFPPEKVGFGGWIDVSPDGRNLGFNATGADGVSRVWVRPIDSLQARLLPGTNGNLFWSSDSRYVVFQSADKLKKIDVLGGPPQTLCDGVGVLLGGSWNADGVIVFGGSNQPILRVSAAGGAASPVTKVEHGRDEASHEYPIFLPDGRHFLYFRLSGQPENTGIYVGSIDVKPEQQSLKRIQAANSSFGYAPSRNGSPARLLFLRDESLMAQAFDERRFEVAGEPTPIAAQVGTSFTRALFSVSLNGVLAYRGGSGPSSEPTWFDREGHNLGRAGEPGHYLDMALSKDASRVAYSRPSQGGNRQIWTLDNARGINTLLGFRPDGSRTPVWSSDGKYVAFSSARGNAIYAKDAANSGSERPVLQTGMTKYLNDWSLDGRYLLYTEATTSLDLFALPDPLGAGERKPIPVANSGFNETQGQFSPDGRWVAYASDESSRFEIYVVPFPPGDGRAGKSLVSSAGGRQPRWRADGKELYYLGLDGSVMAVDTQTDPVFQPATPHALFRAPVAHASNLGYQYDATRDGKKFLMVKGLVGEPSSPVTVVLNWETGLKK
jgi:Tol biopolymer transport system component